ncbi:short-chain dehydrogenase [Microdochium trichocladiopsis]|uniref:Short-chain dehydrogenase n=1 Tax=Microdochium trichocladiopsis TaxID=1682393 RepID=A0A9P8XTR2_9PEZI|nr:short-chain dehydrogenase [Microdochium trichocladiopsis]KAH7014421.1 short-chain dehydrogenase [Microdochium trichocladiopsis]
MRKTTVIPAHPTLTEKNLPDQSGKVFLVTGGNSGVGKALCGILYSHNAKIYIATRSRQRAEEAIAEIRAAYPSSRGQLIFLSLQLDDLTTIAATAREFLSLESRLDVLWANAGVMQPPQGSQSKQGYELQLGTNVLGHFLLTELLKPVLVRTAQTPGVPLGSVRVVIVASAAADEAPKPAIQFDNMDYHRPEPVETQYRRSKAGQTLHALEAARRWEKDGVLVVAMHPGFLVTNLQQNFTPFMGAFFKCIASDAIKGAYTELFAGLDKSITMQHKGCWIAPYGKIEAARKDLQDPELAHQYWAWMEEQVQPYR